MEINSEVRGILKANNISPNIGLLYLLALHYQIDAEELIPLTIKQQIYAAKIVERDYSVPGTVVWNTPLFEGQETAWRWVAEWMNGFEKRNKERRGDTVACMTRMKKFFSENPEVRKGDVVAATELYFKTVKDPQFLKLSHKFIYEGQGKTQSSLLRQYVEQLQKSQTAGGIGNKAGQIIS